MYFPTGAVLSELRNNLPALLHNYGSTQALLNEKLSFYLQCRKENLLVLNGVSQIYPILQRYVEGKRTLIPAPSFGEYSGIFPHAHTYPDRVGIDVETVVESAQSCELVVFVNPTEISSQNPSIVRTDHARSRQFRRATFRTALCRNGFPWRR